MSTQLIRAATILGLAVVFLAPAAPAETAEREEAIALYDAGRYAEARPLLEKIDAAGRADGRLLYRLYYCQNLVGDGAARETLKRAMELLEKESSPALESSFYLANAYRNGARLTEMKRVAAEATARVERGETPRPEAALDMFRLGKLYSDAGNLERASEWYARAVDRSGEDGSLPLPYVTWAVRFLAERAFGEARAEDAAKYYARLADAGEVTLEDLDNLASAWARLGRFEEASATWRKAERMDPARADRARYCGALSRLALGLEQLPQTAPDGRAWAELSQQELESVMQEKSSAAREAIAGAQQGDEPLAPEARASLEAELAAAKSLFVGAGLEYALRRFDIRQAAFSGGYAPMVFHAKRWQLPH